MKINKLFCSLLCLILVNGGLFALADSATASIIVTNYGAKGDLLTLKGVSVVSNSTAIVCPSANFVISDINKLIEVWNAGAFRSVSNETLVATITAISSPSNITVSIAAGRTATGLAGVYGTDNRPAFSNAVAACAVPTDTIIIPEGNYLLIDTNRDGWTYGAGWHAGVILFRGGITFEGQGNVVLTSQGGWRNDSAGVANREMLFLMLSPMTNNYPLVWKNLTLDGGTQGYISNHDYPAHPYDGEGWDTTHHAIAYWQVSSSVILTATNNFFDCTFRGWRGEMIISGLAIQGGFMTASNCVFYDGNATALNMNMAHDWNQCTFHSMRQVEEFYRDYTTNASIIRNCLVTNMFGGAIALNGSYYGCPTYTISNNTFVGCGMLSTTPAVNVLAVSNNIIGGVSGVQLGSAGYQCTFNCGNSNLVFLGNYFTNVYYAFSVQGVGPNFVESVMVASNTFDSCTFIGGGYGWSTNINFQNNLSRNSTVNIGWLDGRPSLQGQYIKDQGNQYPVHIYNAWGNGQTNLISYAYGAKAILGGSSQLYALEGNLGQLPPQAQLWVTNALTEPLPIYLNAAMTGTPVTIMQNSAQTFYWSGSAWTTSQVNNAYYLTVNFGSGSGTYVSGTTVIVVAYPISGKRFAYWSGDTNLMSNPFATNSTITMPAANAIITANYVAKTLAPPVNLRPAQ